MIALLLISKPSVLAATGVHQQTHSDGSVHQGTTQLAFRTLFSSSEAYGFQTANAWGCVPVLARAIGGIPSTFTGIGCGKLFGADADVEDVVAWIQALVSPYDRYLTMRQQLATHVWDFSWDSSALQLKEILG